MLMFPFRGKWRQFIYAEAFIKHNPFVSVVNDFSQILLAKALFAFKSFETFVTVKKIVLPFSLLLKKLCFKGLLNNKNDRRNTLK